MLCVAVAVATLLDGKVVMTALPLASKYVAGPKVAVLVGLVVVLCV